MLSLDCWTTEPSDYRQTLICKDKSQETLTYRYLRAPCKHSHKAAGKHSRDLSGETGRAARTSMIRHFYEQQFAIQKPTSQFDLGAHDSRILTQKFSHACQYCRSRRIGSACHDRNLPRCKNTPSNMMRTKRMPHSALVQLLAPKVITLYHYNGTNHKLVNLCLEAMCYMHAYR